MSDFENQNAFSSSKEVYICCKAIVQFVLCHILTYSLRLKCTLLTAHQQSFALLLLRETKRLHKKLVINVILNKKNVKYFETEVLYQENM